MDIVVENISLSLQVEDRFSILAGRQRINDNDAATRCIGVAHYVLRQWSEQRRFFQEDEPLDVPRPHQLHYPTFAPFRFILHEEDHQDFEEICSKYCIDKHSALAWGIGCIELFEETLVTDRIFIRGAGETKQLALAWIG